MVQIGVLVNYKMFTSQQKIGGPYNASNRKFDALQNDSSPALYGPHNGPLRKFDEHKEVQIGYLMDLKRFQIGNWMDPMTCPV